MGLASRIRLRIGFSAFALIFGLAACSTTVRYVTHPRFASGDDAAKRIDAHFGANIAADHPSVKLGHAKCPVLVDLSGGRTGRCTLPVGDMEMRVDIGVRSALYGLASPDTLIVRRDAEPRIAADLAYAGASADVHCPAPAVRVVQSRSTMVSCALTLKGRSHGTVRVGFSGLNDLFTYGPRTRSAYNEALFSRAVISENNATAVLAGPGLERYLRAVVGWQRNAELARRGLIRRAHCPSRVVLSAGVHVTCTVQLGTSSQRFDVRFDLGRGLVAEPEYTIEIVADVRDRAERFFSYGLPIAVPAVPTGTRVHVDCGKKTVALLIPGESIPCTAYAGKTAYPFEAKLLTAGGDLAFVRANPYDEVQR